MKKTIMLTEAKFKEVVSNTVERYLNEREESQKKATQLNENVFYDIANAAGQFLQQHAPQLFDVIAGGERQNLPGLSDADVVKQVGTIAIALVTVVGGGSAAAAYVKYKEQIAKVFRGFFKF